MLLQVSTKFTFYLHFSVVMFVCVFVQLFVYVLTDCNLYSHLYVYNGGGIDFLSAVKAPEGDLESSTDSQLVASPSRYGRSSSTMCIL